MGIVDDIGQMFGKMLCLNTMNIVAAIYFLIQVFVGDVVLKVHMHNREGVESKLRDLIDEHTIAFESISGSFGIHAHGKFGSHFHADVPKIFTKMYLFR